MYQKSVWLISTNFNVCCCAYFKLRISSSFANFNYNGVNSFFFLLGNDHEDIKTESEERYEDWRERILREAYAALEAKNTWYKNY